MDGNKLDWFLLQQKVMDSREWAHEVSIRELASAFGAFQKNAVELIQKLIWFQESDEAFILMDVNHRDDLNAYWHDVQRLTSNFLSTISPLIEQTRRLIKEFEACGYMVPEYQSRIEVFRKDPCLQFIQDLRNCTQHVVGVPLGSHLSFEAGKGDRRYITVIIEQLRQKYSWNHLALEYMNAQTEDPPFVDPILLYTRETESLYLWLIPSLNQARRVELQHLQEMDTRIRKLMGS